MLFRPKRSTLKSRKDVNLLRTYKFKYSNHEWSGIPIMAANMDGVGELGIAEKLSEFEMITCLTKQHDLKMIKSDKQVQELRADRQEQQAAQAQMQMEMMRQLLYQVIN